MKLTDDLVYGDILHVCNSAHERTQMVFKGYVTDPSGIKWADTTSCYAFIVETGIAEPTDIFVERIERKTTNAVLQSVVAESHLAKIITALNAAGVKYTMIDDMLMIKHPIHTTLYDAAKALCDSCYVGEPGEEMRFGEDAYNNLLAVLAKEKSRVADEGKTEAMYMGVVRVFIIEKNVNRTCNMFYRVMYAGYKPMQRCFDIGHCNIKEPRR